MARTRQPAASATIPISVRWSTLHTLEAPPIFFAERVVDYVGDVPMCEDWSLRGDGRTPARVDFSMEVIEIDESTRIARFRVEPDPRRYDEFEVDGQRMYLDKFLRIAVPMEAFHQQASGLPMYASPATIADAPAYAIARKAALEAESEGTGYVAPKQQAKPQRELPTSSRRALSFVSVDICGSTRLRSLNAAAFDQAFEIFLRELGTVVGQFHGDMLKVTGDGFIAYLDYPGFTLQSDNTLDMSLTLIEVLRNSVNPVLRQQGLPELSIRVGADCGPAVFKTYTVPATGYTAQDVASDALNRAVKIEQSAAPNEFRIGRTLYELVHVDWLIRSTEVKLESDKIGASNYQVYVVH